ncbi:hypothetical protein FB567DRAFT_154576 [Paraphoma chrysanthemicola]|uniref:Uncharacterized protein n=1 Tax=Paraphoma chrysanthemicola TaxID=798071 RepID=A0A8K0VTR6_9PLEO|nr:hypothetical protein FB567DRAFT_154576 [Paraphoma chrysanthemicola]
MAFCLNGCIRVSLPLASTCRTLMIPFSLTLLLHNLGTTIQSKTPLKRTARYLGADRYRKMPRNQAWQALRETRFEVICSSKCVAQRYHFFDTGYAFATIAVIIPCRCNRQQSTLQIIGVGKVALEAKVLMRCYKERLFSSRLSIANITE